MHTGILLALQVGIIRQVEVELDNTLRDLRDSHKEESAKLKKWRVLDKDVQAKLAGFPIQGRHSLSSLSVKARSHSAQLDVSWLIYLGHTIPSPITF